MPQRNVTVRISAEDSFSTVLRNYQSAISRADDNTKKFDTRAGDVSRTIGDRARGLVSKFASLETVVGGVMTAFAGQQVLQIIGNLNKLGTEVTTTRAVFNQLIGPGGADAALQTLREQTRGVVDDLTLMQATNRLMQMGLAGSADEAAGLARMAVTLGGALGKDAGSAMEEFALLLANQSIPRLDTFGISAGRVRTRMAELKDETPGLTREQAFLNAVMEEGTLAMNNLGSAADASATAYARLSTRLQNAKQDAGEFVATGVESGAFILESAVTIVDQLAGGTSEFNDPLRGITDEFTLQLIERTQAALQASQEELMRTSRTTMREGRFISEGGDPLTTAIAAVLTGNRDMPEGLSPEMQSLIAEFSNEQANAIFDEAEAEAAAVAAQRNRIDRAPLTLFGGADVTADFNMGGSAQLGAGMGARFMENRRSQDVANRRDRAPLMLMSAIADEAGRLSGAMQLNEARGARFADEMRRAADEMAKAREDADAMSLSEVFGQTGGGRLGELTGIVASEIADEDMREEFRRAADLMSGRETASSLFLSETLAPAIGTLAGTDPQAAAQAIQNFSSILTELQLAGLDANSGEVLGRGLELAGLSQTGETIQLIEDFDPEEFVNALDQTAEIARLFEEEIDGAHDVQLEVEVIDKNGDLAFLKELSSGGFTNLMARTVQSNGGAVPGADVRTAVLAGGR